MGAVGVGLRIKERVRGVFILEIELHLKFKTKKPNLFK